MNRRKIILPAVAAIVFISVIISGGVLYNRSFSYITPYLDNKNELRGGGVLTASNYSQLKAQLIRLVETAQTDGNIRLYDYLTDVENELPRACHEIMTDTPIGAYAVDVMTIDHTRILSYYDVNVTITYSRSREEVLAVKNADSVDDFRNFIRNSLLGFEKQAAVYVSYYADELYNPNRVKEEILREFPDTLYGAADMRVSFFPETGLHKILLFDFVYREDDKMLKSKRAKANELVSELCTRCESMPEPRKLEYFGEIIRERAEYISEVGANSDAYTPYGVLFGGRGTSIGFAATIKKLCDEANIRCVTVDGSRSGIPYQWNMVLINNRWYSIDSAYFASYGGELLRENTTMTDYEWNELIYPIDIRAK